MYRSALVPRRMAVLGLVGGPLLIVSFALKLGGVYANGTTADGLLTLPEAAWELLLGVYCAWKGFRPDSPIARPPLVLPEQAAAPHVAPTGHAIGARAET